MHNLYFWNSIHYTFPPVLSRTATPTYPLKIHVIYSCLYKSLSLLVMSTWTWIWHHPTGHGQSPCVISLSSKMTKQKWLSLSSCVFLVASQLKVDIRILSWLHVGILNWLDIVQGHVIKLLWVHVCNSYALSRGQGSAGFSSPFIY